MLTQNIMSNFEEHMELKKSFEDLQSLQISNKDLLLSLRQELLYIQGSVPYEAK